MQLRYPIACWLVSLGTAACDASEATTDGISNAAMPSQSNAATPSGGTLDGAPAANGTSGASAMSQSGGADGSGSPVASTPSNGAGSETVDPPAGGTGNEPEPAIGTPEPTTDPGEPEATPGDVPDDADEPLPTTGGAGGTPASAGGTGTGIGGAGTGDSASAPICERWLADRADLSESDWNGDVATCDAGEMEETARANALRMVNLYRFMAGLAPVEMTDETNRLAQSCALLMRANDNLSHSPDDTWTCYKEEAADAAGSSSLSTARTVAAVDGYMVDRGSEDSMGHRRWILSNWLTGVGFGSADNYSCQYQPAGRGAADAPPWVAWPSPGQVPIQALSTLWATVDETGWSIQSDDVDLDEAQVTVMSDGVELPVETMQLGSGYGSTYALRFVPMGWESEVGKTYRVVVSGGSEPLEYDVEVVGCE